MRINHDNILLINQKTTFFFCLNINRQENPYLILTNYKCENQEKNSHLFEEMNKRRKVYSKFYGSYKNAKVIKLIDEASLQDNGGHRPADSSNIRNSKLL